MFNVGLFPFRIGSQTMSWFIVMLYETLVFFTDTVWPNQIYIKLMGSKNFLFCYYELYYL